MSNNLWKSLHATPALLGATLIVSAGMVTAGTATDAPKPETTAPLSANSIQLADASQAIDSPLDQVKAYSSDDAGSSEAGQVTSVSQLSDVRPTDWAFQALQSLVERYGCIAGYPDRTYRGNRAMTRFEFAAGVNACLDRVNELIAASTADLVKKEDLATLQKLQEEFAAELATLRGRVDSLEARATTLEKQQFSTTTKLRGEAVFSVAGALGDDRALNSDQQRFIDAGATQAVRNTRRAAAFTGDPSVQENTTLSNRVRLSLNTSFTGKDLLLTRINAANTSTFGTDVTGTNMTRLSYSGDTGNQAFIDKLFYRFPLGNSSIQIDAVGVEFYNNVPNFNPLLASDGQGSLSRFGRFNPIYRQGQGGSAITVNFKPSDLFTISAGYAARGANDPTDKNGLFNGSNAFLAQLAFQPTKDIGLGFTYVRSYNRDNNNNPLSGIVGSGFADRPFAATPTSGNHFGVEGSIRLNPKIVVAGWAGYTEAKAEENLILGAGAAARQVVARGDNASVWNWAVSLAFPDLGKKGNLAGIIFGMPPKVTNTDYNDPVTGNRRLDRSTSFHLQGLYRYQLNNNISITPGIIVIFNPEHNSDNDTVYVGTVRTTFTF